MRPELSHYLPRVVIDAPISSLHRRLPRISIAWMIGLALVGLAALVALLPGLLAARYLACGESLLPGDAPRAAASFQQALHWSPNDPDIYRALARSYLQLNQPLQAIDALEHAYRLRPESLLIRQE